MISELKTARHLLETCGWVGPKHEPFCVASGPGERFSSAYFEPAASQEEARSRGPLLKSTKWFHTLDAGHEGLLRFSVRGACEAAGASFGVVEAALWWAGKDDMQDLQQWLQQKDRTKEEVASLFVVAIQRVKKSGGRR